MDWQDYYRKKMAIMLKAIYQFDVMSIEIPTQFIIELERAIRKFIWNNKKRIVKTIVNNKRTSGGITMSDLTLCYR